MKTEKFSGTIENAYGNPLPTAIKFDGSFEAYESIEEIKTANDLPSNDEVVNFVNAKRKASKRQASMTAALEAAGIQKPTLEDPKVQYQQMVKILVTAGKSQAEAEQLAQATLGYTPEK